MYSFVDTRIIVAFIILLGVIGLYYKYYYNKEGYDQIQGYNQSDYNDQYVYNINNQNNMAQEQVANQESYHMMEGDNGMPCDPNLHDTPEESIIRNKFASRNKARDRCSYKYSSYDKGNRSGNTTDDDQEWINYYDENNNLVANSQTQDDNGYTAFDETGGVYAPFTSKNKMSCSSNMYGTQNCDPEELYNPDNVLPQEVNEGWWDEIPDALPAKDKHLINITRPFGVGTIGQSNRNQSYDVRGTPVVQKEAISPFLNSGIEPDLSINPVF